MIEYWLTHAKEIDGRKPCLRLLLIAVAARYGGANPGLAQNLTCDGKIKSKEKTVINLVPGMTPSQRLLKYGLVPVS